MEVKLEEGRSERGRLSEANGDGGSEGWAAGVDNSRRHGRSNGGQMGDDIQKRMLWVAYKPSTAERKRAKAGGVGVKLWLVGVGGSKCYRRRPARADQASQFQLAESSCLLSPNTLNLSRWFATISQT